MKTKSFVLLGLFLGIGLTQISAQNGKDGTGTLNLWYEWDGYYMDIPVDCNNEIVDRLVGKVQAHNVNHYMRDGSFLSYVWVIQRFAGTVKSAKSGEVFDIRDILKCESLSNPLCYGHFNLKGDKGSHYIVTYIYDMKDINNMNDDTIEFVKAICN